MRVYVGITDGNWYDYLRDHDYREVNFWRPSGGAFTSLQEGDLFLFKLKASHGGKIAGGGFFVKYSRMSVDWAWDVFRDKNGTQNLAQLSDTIDRYRSKKQFSRENPQIGCIILTDVFYFPEQDWFEAPGKWVGVVQGKGRDDASSEGAWLIEQTRIRLAGLAAAKTETAQTESPGVIEPRYSIGLSKHRLGQSSFRAVVTDAYDRRCAISGERSLPTLQAAHIRASAEGGPYVVQNGLLLRSDIHALFDAGYITVRPNLRVEVSSCLRKDFGNGRMYYAYQGKELVQLPASAADRPAREYLEWHNDVVFRG